MAEHIFFTHECQHIRIRATWKNAKFCQVYLIGVQIRNMKMVFNIYGTWHWVTFEKLMMKIHDFFYSAKSFSHPVRVLERVEQKFHLEGVTKYSNFLQKVGFSIFFIRIKSATPVNFWHKIGELWRPNMKDTATLMTYRERNWLQLMRNYSLVMSWAFLVDDH